MSSKLGILHIPNSLIILKGLKIMSHNPLHDAEGQLAIGQPAPDFKLPNVDGAVVSLDDYRGKVKALCVVFWCNHCPYVILSEDRLIGIAKEYKGKGVAVVAISANDVVNYPQDSPARMKERAAQKGYPFPYLYDADQTVARAFGAKTTPHVFLFDGELKLRYRGSIDDNINEPGAVKVHYLSQALDAILAGKPERIKPAKTPPVGCSVKWKS